VLHPKVIIQATLTDHTPGALHAITTPASHKTPAASADTGETGTGPVYHLRGAPGVLPPARCVNH